MYNIYTYIHFFLNVVLSAVYTVTSYFKWNFEMYTLCLHFCYSHKFIIIIMTMTLLLE